MSTILGLARMMSLIVGIMFISYATATPGFQFWPSLLGGLCIGIYTGINDRMQTISIKVPPGWEVGDE